MKIFKDKVSPLRLIAYTYSLAILAGCAKHDVSAPISGTAKPPIDRKISEQDAPSSRDSKEKILFENANYALVSANWSDLPGWRSDKVEDVWPALLKSCGVLRNDKKWKKICTEASASTINERTNIRLFFQKHFKPAQLIASENQYSGLVTGYYEPLVKGNLKRTKKYKYPIIGISSGTRKQNSTIKNLTRKEIEKNYELHKLPVIAWVSSKIDLFFLQIQGSGRLQLPSGKIFKLAYNGNNEHKYTSIGKILISEGELNINEASMQGIKNWVKRNPSKMDALLNKNKRFVFLKKVINLNEGPIGAFNVPLTPRRSLAVDPRFIPLGYPIYLATTWPNSDEPLRQLMMAQDTGGAIKGPLRADFFWGFGDYSGRLAGKMKQTSQMWLILPRN